MEDDTIEIMKLRKENAHVYKLPPMTSSQGHTTDDFKELIFRGDVKITTKGDLCICYFLNPDQSVFLISVIEKDIEKFIQPAVGSTRYYTLRAMTPTGESGIYGICFKQRSDAFDFYGTINEFKEKLEKERKIEKDKEYKSKYEFEGNMKGINFASVIDKEKQHNDDILHDLKDSGINNKNKIDLNLNSNNKDNLNININLNLQQNKPTNVVNNADNLKKFKFNNPKK